MKKLWMACVFAAALAVSASAAELTGIVTDAKCKHTDTSAASVECAKKCIQAGESAVLVTPDNKVYKIANTEKIENFIGQRVAVTGDVEGETLTVDTIKAAGRRGRKG